MQKKTKLFLAAGAAGLLTLGAAAGIANADMGGGGWGGGHGMGGGYGMRHGMGGPGRMAMQMMERYDANKDGKLSQDEIDTNRAQWLAEFDADKNGSLSLEEFQNLWLKARHQQMVREFQMFDRDGNAQVTLDEYKQPLANMVANHDRNGDGFLSRDDHPRGEHMGKRGHGKWRDGKGDGRGRGQGMMGQGQGNMGDGPGPGMMMDDDQDSDSGNNQQ